MTYTCKLPYVDLDSFSTVPGSERQPWEASNVSFGHRSVAIKELSSTTPFGLAEAFRNEPYSCLLESNGPPSQLSRYSFFCVDPFLMFTSKRHECFAGAPGQLERLPRDPLTELRDLLRRYRFRSEWAPGLPPFLGGAIGYLGYELLYLVEDIPDSGRDDLPVPDCQLLFFDVVFAADSHTKQTWCIANGFGDSDEEAKRNASERLVEALDRARSIFFTVPPISNTLRRRRGERLAQRHQMTDGSMADANVKSVLDHRQYVSLVEEARSEIFAGNVFEICTTNRFDTTYSGPGLELYRTLRTVNEPPFAAYLKLDGLEVISSSPERFVRVDREQWVETRPMKGTRPRGDTKEKDEAAIADLASDEKSSAENIMIVDLARNDLGRVCRFETVHVPQLRVVETYPFTHQLVSTVRGRLLEGLDVVDVIRATFPGGSMTGAPKVESLKIIDRLEPVKRGVYSGSIGYIDFDGAADLNIVIRTMIKKGNNLSFHVGGAIVADSDPEGEYQETLDKAHGMIVALELTRERIGE